MIEIIGIDKKYIVNKESFEYVIYKKYMQKYFVSLDFAEDLIEISENEYLRLREMLLVDFKNKGE